MTNTSFEKARHLSCSIEQRLSLLCPWWYSCAWHPCSGLFFLQVITDPLTGRSKGYGFVRFGSEAERDRALGEMMGHLISNRPIRVSIATAKKNPPGAPSANAASANAPHPSDFDPANTTLFIGGLSASVTEEELHSMFGRFGEIIYVKIPPGKGCGFVQYVHRSVAEVAMATMQSQACPSLIKRIKCLCNHWQE